MEKFRPLLLLLMGNNTGMVEVCMHFTKCCSVIKSVCYVLLKYQQSNNSHMYHVSIILCVCLCECASRMLLMGQMGGVGQSRVQRVGGMETGKRGECVQC